MNNISIEITEAPKKDIFGYYGRTPVRHISGFCDDLLKLFDSSSYEIFGNQESFIARSKPDDEFTLWANKNFEGDLKLFTNHLEENRKNFDFCTATYKDNALWLFRGDSINNGLFIADMRETLGQVWFFNSKSKWQKALKKHDAMVPYLPASYIEIPRLHVWKIMKLGNQWCPRKFKISVEGSV